MFPEAQAQAQKELDEVVGSGELPSAKHFKDLPYVRGTMKETLRWMPIAINGAVPHATINSDEFNGYHIPQGASIILAVWAASNDETYFPQPRLFDPMRHNQTSTIFESSHTSEVPERGQYTFGAGRRICPGMHVAENTLLFAMTRILWAFDIQYAKDENGNDIFIDRDAVAGGLAACPVPFK